MSRTLEIALRARELMTLHQAERLLGLMYVGPSGGRRPWRSVSHTSGLRVGSHDIGLHRARWAFGLGVAMSVCITHTRPPGGEWVCRFVLSALGLRAGSDHVGLSHAHEPSGGEWSCRFESRIWAFGQGEVMAVCITHSRLSDDRNFGITLLSVQCS